MLDAKRVGARIRHLREERGLTQERLAYECGRAKSYLCEIEAGKKQPSLQMLSDLAIRLEVPLFDLLLVPTDGIREQVVDATRGQSVETLQRLLSVIPVNSRTS